MKAVINLSTPKYKKGQDRLIQTLNTHCTQDVLTFQFENLVEAKPHSECMYGFKPKSFIKAYEMGYTTILWLDASMYVIKDLTPIFEQIEQDGYFFQDSGWSNERWTTEAQRKYFGTNKGTMISSGVVGLDLTTQDASDFLYLWNVASEDGMFNGTHDVTRHDQTAASLIIHNMGLKITDNNTFWQYGKPDEQPLHDNILIIANGIV